MHRQRGLVERRPAHFRCGEEAEAVERRGDPFRFPSVSGRLRRADFCFHASARLLPVRLAASIFRCQLALGRRCFQAIGGVSKVEAIISRGSLRALRAYGRGPKYSALTKPDEARLPRKTLVECAPTCEFKHAASSRRLATGGDTGSRVVLR